MKTITTTREWDAEGRLIKETVCEQVTADPVPYVFPAAPNTFTPNCTCGTTVGYCPVHQSGWSFNDHQIICGSHTGAQV